MMSGMLSSGRKKIEIFNSVICFDLIQMMDDLTFLKKPTELSFGNQDLLWNVPAYIGVRVIGLINMSVALSSYVKSFEIKGVFSLPKLSTWRMAFTFKQLSEFLFSFFSHRYPLVPSRFTPFKEAITRHRAKLSAWFIGRIYATLYAKEIHAKGVKGPHYTFQKTVGQGTTNWTALA